MQFGTVTVDPDAWTGTGTVVGTHTHTAPIVFADGGKITNEIDQESTLEVQTTEVVISKGLRVIGQLVAPGFPPPGGDMSLPTDPTFNSVVCTDTLRIIGETTLEDNVTCDGDLTVQAVITAGKVESTGEINAQTHVVAPLVSATSSVTAPHIECTTLTTLGTISAKDIYVTEDVQVIADIESQNLTCNNQINCDTLNVDTSADIATLTTGTLYTNAIEPPGTLAATGTWDFTNATVQGISGTGYNSITEYTDHIDITKRLTMSHMGWNNDNIMNFQGNKKFIDFTNFEGTVDFTDATVVGLQIDGTSYPSIRELSDRITMTKHLDMGISNIITPYIGTDDAGIELDENGKEIVMYIDNKDMMWRLYNTEGGTTILHYSQQSWMNHMQCHTISHRPGYTKVDFQGIMDFSGATVQGLYPGFSHNSNTNRLEVDTDTTLFFKPTMDNPGVATEISQYDVLTNSVGRSLNKWVFETYDLQNDPVCTLYQDNRTILQISDELMLSQVPFKAPKKGSSGNFTHCHLTEGLQGTAWEVGRLVTSTGEFCSRDDTGALIANPVDAPDTSYAVCKVQYSSAGDNALGVIASVEHVASNEVEHEHGGITLKAAVQEADGHQMVRVASSGDVMAWVVEPTFQEIDTPSMSGLWQKCVDNGGYNGGHTVLSNHVGVEADGYLSVDGQIIDTQAATVTVEADKICVYPTDPTLTPELFSGVYTKSINGITQPIQVVMHCNRDYSFSFSEHFPGFESRVAALEATIAELTGPE